MGHQRNIRLRDGRRAGLGVILLMSGSLCLGCPPAPSAEIPPAKLLVVPGPVEPVEGAQPDTPEGGENAALPVVFPGSEGSIGTDAGAIPKAGAIPNDGDNSPVLPELQDAGRMPPVDGLDGRGDDND